MASRLGLTATLLAFLSSAARAGELEDAGLRASALLGSSPFRALAARTRAAAAAAPAPRTWTGAIELAEQAIVRVDTPGHFGTGFIVRANGLVVTNAHLVTDVNIGSELDILLAGAKLKGKLVASGNEKCRDLALIQLSGRSTWPTLPLNRATPRKGQEVVALGFPGGPADRTGSNPLTVSRGIVSGVDRIYPDTDCGLYVQTDASVNSGNSGGPLITLDGTVVGVNTWGFSDKQQMNFAIRIPDLERALAQFDRVKHLAEGSVGLMVAADSDKKKLIVTQSLSGRAAEKAGIRQGDELVAYEGRPAGQDEAAAAIFIRWVRELVPGDTVRLTVSRGGVSRSLPIVVEKFNPPPPQRLADFTNGLRRG